MPDSGTLSRARPAEGAARGTPRRLRKLVFSPLLRRILLVNALPLGLLVAALLYLDTYQDGLIDAEAASLRVQAQVFAGAIGESATSIEDPQRPVLVPDLARPLLRRLVEPTPFAQARLYDRAGELVADSRVRTGPGGAVTTEPLPPPPPRRGPFATAIVAAYEAVMTLLPRTTSYPVIGESDEWNPDIRPLLAAAVEGQGAPLVRRTADGRLVVSVAVPAIRNRETVGVVLLTREAREVDEALFQVRMTILAAFGLALALTVALSFYLSTTIARPLLRLARAAERMREGRGRRGTVQPSLRARRDEIGALAQALDESATALWNRMDAIERFAADVAHEIKNPLTSIRSAIETLRRVQDPERQQRLLAVIADDVKRLDRLISDISDASRVDAELSRVAVERVDIAPILATLADIHETTRTPDAPRLVLEAPAAGLTVNGLEGRLVQVFRNLIGNAVSFSPKGGTIRLIGRRTGGMVEVAVEDEGPGIPEAKLEHIFERFYSERPQGEQFGTHSGLGLSISRQIVEALRGRIVAENRRDEKGAVIGARFVVRLPEA
ncbi:HAMP domain-containing protein [Elioraea sp. Yellowstone]|jgi:two-component system sensor histidine kinase ChvG|uniref:sensor histidine kinase n=1 Tax=Elioraea sp. Yellowstone TaxID=2592070 RepID=UPI00114F0FB0|nr:stimulus-sensing domain-containing protein [Elioraea sp. Yellowstone]TQF81124.1 HAMP domain-containing protein [Elioraea sp. Yellowstone]